MLIIIAAILSGFLLGVFYEADPSAINSVLVYLTDIQFLIKILGFFIFLTVSVLVLRLGIFLGKCWFLNIVKDEEK